ncbi:MAG: hypothetical protein ISN28_14460 [Ectothiorhodospiraceae bacterium AqS1]|nr:hypothetical protein [Ectothiorhodospiraceae bacterium AqS1]
MNEWPWVELLTTVGPIIAVGWWGIKSINDKIDNLTKEMRSELRDLRVGIGTLKDHHNRSPSPPMVAKGELGG